MRFGQAIKGHFYRMKKASSSGYTHSSGTRNKLKLKENDVLECIRVQPQVSGYWSSQKTQHTLMKLWENGVPTDDVFMFTNHSPLELYEETIVFKPGQNDRETEKNHLQKQIGIWKKELQVAVGTVENLQTQINAAEKRLENLQAYTSDTEALAAVLKDKFGKELDQHQLNELVRQAGININ